MPATRPPPLAPAVGALLGAMQHDPSPLSDPRAFLPLVPADEAGTVAAVDGGQSLLAELGSCGVLAVRAGYTVRRPGDAYEDDWTLNEVLTVTRRTHDAAWLRLARQYAKCG